MNTQFQYIDVGVNIEVTPRVHPDGDISMKLVVDVSQITGTSNIGGINQPVIGQKKVEHDVRLKEGEISILGGLIERTDTKNINGIPGIGEAPLMRYLFSDNSHEIEEDETLIVLTPHILRLPSLTAENLRSMAAGTDSNVRVYHEGGEEAPAQPAAAPAAPPTRQNSAVPAPAPGITPTGMTQPPAQPGAGAGAAVQLHFEPAMVVLKAGDTTTLGLAISNVTDLFLHSADDSLRSPRSYKSRKCGTADSFPEVRSKSP